MDKHSNGRARTSSSAPLVACSALCRDERPSLAILRRNPGQTSRADPSAMALIARDTADFRRILEGTGFAMTGLGDGKIVPGWTGSLTALLTWTATVESVPLSRRVYLSKKFAEGAGIPGLPDAGRWTGLYEAFLSCGGGSADSLTATAGAWEGRSSRSSPQHGRAPWAAWTGNSFEAEELRLRGGRGTGRPRSDPALAA